jgi:5-methylcytosine-specific restriction endonuclease McrA
MDTLVLSSAYVPVAHVTWQRAVTLIWLGKVEVVEEYQDRRVHSVTLEIKVPSIIRFLRKFRHRKQAVKFSRENVYTRDKGRCQYCGHKVTRPGATYDHVLPRSLGGATTWENVVIACSPCNQRKGGRTPEQAGMRVMTPPVKPAWLPETWRLTFLFHPDTPASWRQFFRDFEYWQGELEHDGE